MKLNPALVRALIKHVRYLSAAPREPKSLQHRRSRVYIEQCLNQYGVAHPVQFESGDYTGVNVLTDPFPRNRPDLPLVVVGAHYDTVPGSPGADDNASGVAVMLELQKSLSESIPENGDFCRARIQFAAYDLEEYQGGWGFDDCIGSTDHCTSLLQAGTNVTAMFSLEMLGYSDSRPGSQQIPWPISLVYPRNLPGDFIVPVGNRRSRQLSKLTHQAFKKVTDLRSDLKPPIVLCDGKWCATDTRRSDHRPFWDAGIQALMITDTANFRNPNYHKRSDTPDTLDFDFMAKVKMGMEETLINLLCGSAAIAEYHDL